MANKRYMKQKIISILDQMIALRVSYPTAKCNVKKDTLLWFGKIRPTPLSKEYTVLLKYKLWESPTVWVIGDELQKLDDPDFPHKYNIYPEDKMVEICLYLGREFSVSKFLSKTIIPWAIEWLYFYEIWLFTGEWHGGGKHPNTEEAKEKLGSCKPPNLNLLN